MALQGQPVAVGDADTVTAGGSGSAPGDNPSTRPHVTASNAALTCIGRSPGVPGSGRKAACSSSFSSRPASAQRGPQVVAIEPVDVDRCPDAATNVEAPGPLAPKAAAPPEPTVSAPTWRRRARSHSSTSSAVPTMANSSRRQRHRGDRAAGGRQVGAGPLGRAAGGPGLAPEHGDQAVGGAGHDRAVGTGGDAADRPAHRGAPGGAFRAGRGRHVNVPTPSPTRRSPSAV